MDFQVGEGSTADPPYWRAIEAQLHSAVQQRVQPSTPHPLISPQAGEGNGRNNNNHLIGALTALETVPMVTHMSLQ